MTDVKIGSLVELAAVPATGDYIPIVDISEGADEDKTKYVTAHNLGCPVFLATPLTSTDWDGDSFSTTAKTVIDLSTAFSAPAGIRAVNATVTANDSGSAASPASIYLAPNDTADIGTLKLILTGITNDVALSASGIVPCSTGGDIYYQIVASSTDTLDAHIEIWGYWL